MDDGEYKGRRPAERKDNPNARVARTVTVRSGGTPMCALIKCVARNPVSTKVHDAKTAFRMAPCPHQFRPKEPDSLWTCFLVLKSFGFRPALKTCQSCHRLSDQSCTAHNVAWVSEHGTCGGAPHELAIRRPVLGK